MKATYGILFSLHIFVGIGAIFGGTAAILNPQQPLGAPIEVLKNSPFSNYLIPGIILFSIIGLGNLSGALAVIIKSKFQVYISSILGFALIIWIIVQCIVLNGIHFLHILFLVIGIIESTLSIVILFKLRLFPANIICNYFKAI